MKNKLMYILTGGGGSSLTAFTMAEILLSLTIIGVVAAITLPSLTGNINERTWNTQRKALYARFSQAIALMPALNGYGELKEASSSGASDAVDTAAETFVTAGLSKVLKINNICDSEHLQDCGITSKINTLGGSQIMTPATMSAFNADMVGSKSNNQDKMSVISTKAAAFETANGESIITYYNPSCLGSLNELPLGGNGGYYIAPKVCANFVYDLNGNKGPNTVGKDIGFITVMYPSDPKVVAPIPATRQLSAQYPTKSTTGKNASQACTDYDAEYRVPNVEEAMSLLVNKNLLQGADSELSGWYATSGVISSSLIWTLMAQYGGQIDDNSVTRLLNVWCVKR
ncbi:MAG: type II secretion system GspH family protein [Fusobacterium sp.]|nr:type II secretion system GspH family protein [Fusobacterium sp.]